MTLNALTPAALVLRTLWLAGWLLAMTAATGPALAQDDPAPTPSPDTTPQPAPRLYNVTHIQIAVLTPGLPELDWSRISVSLMHADNGGYVPAPSLSFPTAFSMPLNQVGQPLSKASVLALQGSAIRTISLAIVQAYNDAGYGAVLVELASDQFDAQANDIRPQGQTGLTFNVRALGIAQVQSRAAGDRFKDDPTNHPAHQRIIEDSPVVAGDLLRTHEIERYTRFLSRHPGRRVDAAVSQAPETNALSLDYLVQENKPWTLFASVSNTGTEQTSTWREQFGFTHYQLTGHDDILAINYSTAGFEDTHAISGSYEVPLFHPRLRGKVFASYSEFVASDVGFAGEEFSGQSHSVGTEVEWNFFQQGDWFIDAFAGVQYQDIQVDNELFMPTLEGRDRFFRPSAGLRTQRITQIAALFGSIGFDWNADDIAGTTAIGASELGRTAVDAQWIVLSYSASASIYLEPLIDRAAWEDLTSPGSTLAHEMVLSLRGQNVLGDQRTIPQAQITAGGLYTVRGYDESTAVGDNAVLVTAEYRFHLPRVLTPQPQPTQVFGHDFRVAPPSPRGRPDWDLILKAFIDYAHTSNNNPQLGENDNDLLGVGVGTELQIKRYLSIRVDWGVALQDAQEVREGDNRFHIAATLMY